MNLVTLFKLFLFPQDGWKDVVSSNASILRLFLLHVVPFALIPPVFIYLAGHNKQILFFNLLSQNKLLLACIAFFIIQLIAVPLMAVVIKNLAEIAEVKPTYHQSFTLASIAPTPLWMMPVFLLVPDISVLMVIGTFAMMAAAGFIYYGIPEVLHVFESGHHYLLFGALLTAGLMAWGFLMISTFVIWGSLQNLHMAL